MKKFLNRLNKYITSKDLVVLFIAIVIGWSLKALFTPHPKPEIKLFLDTALSNKYNKAIDSLSRQSGIWKVRFDSSAGVNEKLLILEAKNHDKTGKQIKIVENLNDSTRIIYLNNLFSSKGIK